jgi:transposase
MGLNRRKFTREFKEAAVRRLELGASVAEVSSACEVNPNVLHRWRRELREFGAKAFTGPGRNRADENRIAALERKVGQQVVEGFPERHADRETPPKRSLDGTPGV